MPSVRLFAGLMIIPGLLLAQQQPPQGPPTHGITARSAPSDYAAQATGHDTSFAASLLPPAQVKKLFAFDISKDYVVLEIAAYPKPGTTLELTPDDFVLHVAKTGDIVRGTDPTTIASAIQQKNLPRRGNDAGPTVVAATDVGYESGRDPYTGQRVHGTYTDTSVGVATGGDPGPPRMPSPGGYPQDRDLLENQLWDRLVPEGHFDRAVAGYLYFPASLVKKKGSTGLELEYLGTDRVKLAVPAK